VAIRHLPADQQAQIMAVLKMPQSQVDMLPADQRGQIMQLVSTMGRKEGIGGWGGRGEERETMMLTFVLFSFVFAEDDDWCDCVGRCAIRGGVVDSCPSLLVRKREEAERER